MGKQYRYNVTILYTLHNYQWLNILCCMLYLLNFASQRTTKILFIAEENKRTVSCWCCCMLYLFKTLHPTTHDQNFIHRGGEQREHLLFERQFRSCVLSRPYWIFLNVRVDTCHVIAVESNRLTIQIAASSDKQASY